MDMPDLSDAIAAARQLIGWKLVTSSPEGITAGIIVETEAYVMSDPASHAFGGPKQRNLPMFKDAGTIYVYFTYGMHYCVNIVTGSSGDGQAVLIRALQPTEGMELMMARRNINNPLQLASGPAKLTQALGITIADNDQQLGGHIRIEPGIQVDGIVATTRVGISKNVEKDWRFFVENNPYISKRSRIL
jgi:DNA-3-methyladenine glycosylase